MPKDMEEIKSLVEKTNEGVAALKTELEDVKGSVSEADAETKAKFDKITESITKHGEDLQKMQEKSQALEAAQARLDSEAEGEGEKADKEMIEKSEKAFDAYLRHGDVQAVKDAGFDVGSEGVELRAMSTDVDPDGGYLVMPERVSQMVTRNFETSPLRNVANVITTASKSVEMVIDDDEIDSSRSGEGSAASDSDTPELGIKTITAHKYDAEPRVTIEMLQDASIDVESWLSRKATSKITRDQNYDFILGNAVGRARGILTYPNYTSPGVYQRGAVEQINLGAAAAVTGDGLIGLQSELQEVYQGDANWLMKRQTLGGIYQLKGNDQYFFGPTFLKDGTDRLQLLGKPVNFMQDMPAVAANALAVAYGDFNSGYTIIDRAGVQILRDPYTSKSLLKVYYFLRTGGDVTNYESFKIGKIAA